MQNTKISCSIKPQSVDSLFNFVFQVGRSGGQQTSPSLLMCARHVCPVDRSPAFSCALIFYQRWTYRWPPNYVLSPSMSLKTLPSRFYTLSLTGTRGIELNSWLSGKWNRWILNLQRFLGYLSLHLFSLMKVRKKCKLKIRMKNMKIQKKWDLCDSHFLCVVRRTTTSLRIHQPGEDWCSRRRTQHDKNRETIEKSNQHSI